MIPSSKDLNVANNAAKVIVGDREMGGQFVALAIPAFDQFDGFCAGRVNFVTLVHP